MDGIVTLIGIISMIANVIVTLVIVQFIISLLFSFNVINGANEFMMSIYRSINMLLDPLLQPIRRIMPHTGAIDFSPIVLILGLRLLVFLLSRAAMGTLV